MKILLFDIETSPNMAWIWRKYEQDAIGDFLQERIIISVAWKWVGKDKVYSDNLPKHYGYRNMLSGNIEKRWNNERLVKRIHSIFSEADIIVAHNGDSFDIPISNTAFVTNKMRPPSTYRTIDTLKVARHKFGFNSNKLDDLGQALHIGRKVKHEGFDMWMGCLRGDRKWWSVMDKYNKKDIVLLESVYLAMRPWMSSHPNINVETEQVLKRCPACSANTLVRRGFTFSNLGKRQRYQCAACGKWSVGEFYSAKLTVK